MGRVVTVNGQPIILPGLGSISAALQKSLGSYAKYLSVLFLILGLLSVMGRGSRTVRRRKPRRRLRLRHIYKAVTVSAVFIVMLSIYFGSRVAQVKYLVSEYPGTLGDQVPLDRPGSLILEVKNNGFVPVWTIPAGIAPLSIDMAPEYIGARASKMIVLKVEPQHQTGVYQGYVQVYNYPVLLPRKWIVYLHRVNPVFAIAAAGLAAGLLFTLFFKGLSRIHGFEGWIPLHAMKDKIMNRRINRTRSKLLGRRRAR